jgi:hypothetical protein
VPVLLLPILLIKYAKIAISENNASVQQKNCSFIKEQFFLVSFVFLDTEKQESV